MVINEGETTWIMSFSCWKSIGSLQLTKSQTILKDFDGRFFKPNVILTSLSIEMGGKIVSVEFKLVNSMLDYNLLLGHTWFYAMKAITSTIFHIICFPHQGNIVTIDPFDYCTPDLRANPSTNVSFIVDSSRGYEGVGKYSPPFSILNL